MNEDQKFFEHGYISVLGVDRDNRRSIYSISIPYVLLIRVIPVMLGCGSITDIQIADPLAVWQPEITNKDIKSGFLISNSPVGATVWRSLKKQIDQFLAYYVELCHILKEPHIVNHALPMGTYVKLTFIAEIDKVPACLVALQSFINVEGVAEFQFALSAALSESILSMR